MGTDYFQFQVSKGWYRAFWVIMLLVNLLLVVGYALFKLAPSIAETMSQLGISEAAVIFGGIGLIYLGAVYWFVDRRSGALASLIGIMLLVFTILNGLDQTGAEPTAYIYVGLWAAASLMIGSFGLPLMGVFALLTISYVATVTSFEFASMNQPTLVLLIVTAAALLVGTFFWKKYYINLESQKVNQLSGMLKSSRQRSEILIESIADAVVVTDTNGKITLMNPAASAMSGWGVEEALGLEVQSVIALRKEDGSEIADVDNPFQIVATRQQKVSQSLQIVSRDNKQLVVSLTASPVIMPETSEYVGVVSVFRDISEERAAEKQRADFISTASHEMRTPVAAIEGYLALALNDKVSTIDDRAKGFLEKAHSSTQHLGKLFQDLLTSSKAEDGRLNNHPQVVEMGAFTQQLTEDLKFSAEKRGLIAEFIVGAASDNIDASRDASEQHMLKPLYYTHVDPERIREVITNLFDNACKYTDTGKISIGLTGDNQVVQLYVKDTGAGIPAEDIHHLFQKFYRVDSSATRTIGGTGLGLYICRKIIELYNGRIWVESEVGKGSTFFINLPRLTTQQANDLLAKESARK